MKQKILSLLVLLMTAATGAWAQKQITITQGFEDGMGDWTTNHCHNSTGISSSYGGYEGFYSFRFYYTADVPQYLISPELDENDGGTMSFYYARYSSNYPETFKVGYSTTTSEPSAFTWGDEVTSTNMYGDDYLEYTYDFPAGTKYVSIACTSNDQFYFFVDAITIEYAPAEAPTDVEVTTNAASEGATFTEATFAMPAFDATAEYELVRDMSVQMPVTVGDGEDGYRIRVKKNAQEKFEPADMSLQDMFALYTVHDDIENKDLVFYGQTVDCDLSIYAVDDNDQPIGDAITDFSTLVPGRYVAMATAANGSDYYDGETGYSNIFVLYQGYEVTVPAGEFITYFKDEALYVEDDDVQLFTITEVSETTATATELSIAPANTAILVKNNSADEKTFLLIPTLDQADNVEAYEGFIGTLVDATIAASTEGTTNYALNGRAFVFVKNDIAIAANKAWLSISNSNARTITLVFDETTKITNTNLTNLTNGDWYDLNGRKLNGMPTKKGVYINNGRKVVVK